MATQTLVGVALGTSTIATIVARVSDSGRIDIYGIGKARSKGIERGMIVDIDAAAEALRTSARRAERMSGFRIETAVIGISGRHISALNNRGVVAAANPANEITEHDVARAVESAQAITLASQREIIHVIPRMFRVDASDEIRDPIGMSGHRLEVEAHIVTGDKMAIDNIIKTVQRAGIGIADLVVQPHAAAEAVLSDDDKDRGVVLIDIGGGTTSIAVYMQGAIHHTAILPFGGGHLTNDLAIVYQIPQQTSEELKHTYGDLRATTVADSEQDTLTVEGFGPDARQHVSRGVINKVLYARAEEMTDLMAAELQHGQVAQVPRAGIVITGGLAQLAGFDELIHNRFGMPVRVGLPIDIHGLTDGLDTPAVATAVGLVRWGARRQSIRQLDTAPLHNAALGLSFSRVSSWLKVLLP